MGLTEIKRVFDDYLEEKYIEDEDIMEYIKEFDKDKNMSINKLIDIRV